jgi:molybdopterin molybdotransferase
MPEFLQLLPPAEALNRLLEHLPTEPRLEEVETSAALGRVTIFPVVAPHPLPEFARSTVDGYALRASDPMGKVTPAPQ